tara:strand:+ start:101 stop:337 length:237 start_codon:yes stop_codon:yes gene_type:complete
MLGEFWVLSSDASRKLRIKEKELSELREYGILKPGIHWKSSPIGQNKPWNPNPIYNVESCKKLLIEKDLFDDSSKLAA